ncbi:MAG TPA: extracellular solute-binding protein [Clostridia bacterium]|nr:extracellular solute-binding protein [Clostridia bacterium]
MLKRTVSCVLALLIMAVLLPGPAGHAQSDLPPVKLTMMSVNGRETSRTNAILDEINRVLTEKLNVTLEYKTVEQEAYKISLTGLEGVDLIYTADYLAYYDNARQGAYAQIGLEDIQKYMPTWYADNQDKLPSATVDGMIYAIPDARPWWNSPCMVVRKDWFPEGMDEIRSLEDLDKYLGYVKETHPGIMPVAFDTGTVSWVNGAFAFGATNLMAPGGPNCTSVVCLNKTDDPNYRLLATWKQEQLIPFFEVMKDFADKGYWTPDGLNNPTSMSESFQNGQSGGTWITNINSINSIYQQMMQLQPEAVLGVYDFGLENNVPVDTYSPMGSAIAMPRTGKNQDRALMLIELIYSDPDVYRLFRYGISGEDYTLNEKGEVILSDVEAGLGYGAVYANRDYDFVPDGGYWPGWEELQEQIRSREQQNPFVGFGMDTTPVSDIANNLWNVHMEYAMPIYLGFVSDVTAAVAELNRQYDLVGYQAYEDEAFKQLEQYLQDSGLTEFTITR